MAFTFNSGGKVEGNLTDNPISFNYTAGTNSRLLVLSLTAHNNVPSDITSGTPTYASGGTPTAMTKCGSTQLTTEGGTEQWYFIGPDDNTSRAISIPNASGNELHYVVSDYTSATEEAQHF